MFFNTTLYRNNIRPPDSFRYVVYVFPVRGDVDMEVMILFFPLKIDNGSIERASGSCQGLDTSLIRVNSAVFIYLTYSLTEVNYALEYIQFMERDGE